MFPIRNYQKNIIHSLILELRDAGLESVDRRLYDLDRLSFGEANRLIRSLCTKLGMKGEKYSMAALNSRMLFFGILGVVLIICLLIDKFL